MDNLLDKWYSLALIIKLQPYAFENISYCTDPSCRSQSKLKCTMVLWSLEKQWGSYWERGQTSSDEHEKMIPGSHEIRKDDAMPKKIRRQKENWTPWKRYSECKSLLTSGCLWFWGRFQVNPNIMGETSSARWALGHIYSCSIETWISQNTFCGWGDFSDPIFKI